MSWQQAKHALAVYFSFALILSAGQTVSAQTGKTAATRPSRADHLTIQYMDRAVPLAVASAIRAVRKYEPRLVREDLGQVVAHDNRYARAAVRAVTRDERAADQGYVMAHYNLARAVADGRGVKRDYGRALSSFGIAAQSGNVPAMLRLAEIYFAGLGTVADRVQAQAFYYVAASLQSEAARHAQGLMAEQVS